MNGLALAPLGLVAAGLGLAAAQLAGPVACTWPSFSSTSLVERIERLRDGVPGRHRRVAGGVALMLILIAAGVMAYAAYPAAPARLAVLARGAGAALRLADPLGLTPNPATASTAAQQEGVGLDPAGAAAAAPVPAAPATVTAPGLPDAATIERYMTMGYARWGSTFISPEAAADPEHRRSAAYGQMIVEETERRQAEIVAGTRTGSPGLAPDDQKAFLGEAAYADMMALNARWAAQHDAEETASLAAQPITGPSTYYQPAGMGIQAAITAAGVDPRGVWTSHLPDAEGGRLWTRIYQTAAEMRAANLASPANRIAAAGP